MAPGLVGRLALLKRLTDRDIFSLFSAIWWPIRIFAFSLGLLFLLLLLPLLHDIPIVDPCYRDFHSLRQMSAFPSGNLESKQPRF